MRCTSEIRKEEGLIHMKDANDEQRKVYYVSVQAGQILEDQHAAAYELVIHATDEEIAQLHQLFKQYASKDEAQSIHFGWNPFETASDLQMNSGTDGMLKRIYELLFSCGTESTRNHIETMDILQRD